MSLELVSTSSGSTISGTLHLKFPPYGESIGADRTLENTDNMKVFIVEAADLTITLPTAPPAGWRASVVVSTLSATTGAKIQAAGANSINTTLGSYTNTAATDAVGDRVDLVYRGSEGGIGRYVATTYGIWAGAVPE